MIDRSVIAVFDELYHTTQKKVLRYIMAKCGNPSDIGDIFQETYMEVYSVLVRRGADYVRDGGAFAMKVARQKIYRHYTLFEKCRWLVPFRASNGEEEDFDLPVEEIGYSVIDETLATDQQLARVGMLLAKKPVLTRKIFHLYYSLELTIPQIARELSINPSTVKNRIYRTLAEIREQLSADDTAH